MQNTLDPPGSIAILGGGPVGIEAALYGRYLGYQVTLFEADRLAASLWQTPEQSAPANFASPLGVAALAAQRASGGTALDLEVTTCQQWAEDYFQRLGETDLLSGRIRLGQPVTRIAWAPPEEEGESEEAAGDEEPSSDEVPADFFVFCSAADEEPVGERFEAIIDARGAQAPNLGPHSDGAPIAEYYFRVGRCADPTMDYITGLDQIRSLFAALQDRPGLDVYRNLGG